MSFMQQSYESHTASVTVEVGQSVSHFHRGGRLILSLTGLSLGLQISLMHRPIMLVFFFCEPSSIGGHGQPNRQVSQEAALNANVANTIIRSTFPLAINTGNMRSGVEAMLHFRLNGKQSLPSLSRGVALAKTFRPILVQQRERLVVLLTPVNWMEPLFYYNCHHRPFSLLH